MGVLKIGGEAGRPEAADKVILDAVHAGDIRVDSTTKDGKAIFHLHRKNDVVCKRCKHVSEDELISTCPKCGAAARRIPGVLATRPRYQGPWGPSITEKVRSIAEALFKDGELEWVAEVDSWFIRPAGQVMDRALASRKILEALTAP